MSGASGDAMVLALLQAGHLSVEDLLRLAGQVAAAPAADHATFTPVVEAACPAPSLRTCLTTFRRLMAASQGVALDAVTTAQLETLMQQVVAAARARGHTDGSGAARGFIHGARLYHGQAVGHGVKSPEVVYDGFRVMLRAVRPSRPAW